MVGQRLLQEILTKLQFKEQQVTFRYDHWFKSLFNCWNTHFTKKFEVEVELVIATYRKVVFIMTQYHTQIGSAIAQAGTSILVNNTK
jgi:hypothetical protein